MINYYFLRALMSWYIFKLKPWRQHFALKVLNPWFNNKLMTWNSWDFGKRNSNIKNQCSVKIILKMSVTYQQVHAPRNRIGIAPTWSAVNGRKKLRCSFNCRLFPIKFACSTFPSGNNCPWFGHNYKVVKFPLTLDVMPCPTVPCGNC